MVSRLPKGRYTFKQGVYQAGYAAGRAYRNSEGARKRAGAAAQRGKKRVERKIERGVEQGTADIINGAIYTACYAAAHLIVVVGAIALALFTIFYHYADKALDIANSGNMGLVFGAMKLLGINVPGGVLGQGGANDANMGDKGPMVQLGDTFKRHDGGTVTVNSGWGPRNTGIPGASRFHRGVDLPLELGYPLKAWTTTTVTCSTSKGYGDNGLATLKTKDGKYIAGHVNTCMPGDYTEGQTYATVGTKGVSSGYHLHWGQYNALGALEPPQAHPLQATLIGYWPVSNGAASPGEVDLKFIKGLEGYSDCAYNDGAQWSWGYGTKAPGSGYCLPGGRAQAEEEMVSYISERILPNIPDGLNACQKTAVISFAYNTGTGPDSGWDIWKEFTPSGNPQFTRYTRATTGASLLPRRQKEQAKWGACS